MPVSRMVVLPERSFFVPPSDHDSESTCQKPWELFDVVDGACQDTIACRCMRYSTHLSTAVYVRGLEVTSVSMYPRKERA